MKFKYIIAVLFLMMGVSNLKAQDVVYARTGEKINLNFTVSFPTALYADLSGIINISNYRVFLLETAYIKINQDSVKINLTKIDNNNYSFKANTGLNKGYSQLVLSGEVLAGPDTLCDIKLSDLKIAENNIEDIKLTLHVIPDSPGEVYYKPCYFEKCTPDPVYTGADVKFIYYVDCISNVKFRISDSEGRTTDKIEYSNVQRGRNEGIFQIPLSYCAGAYFVELFTDCGYATKQFIIIK